MFVRTFITIAALVASSAASAGYRSTVDDDGCWDGLTPTNGDCLVREEAVRKGDRLKVSFRNTCSERVYAQICLQRNGMNDDCGANSVKPGVVWSYYTSQSTGRYKINFIGSADFSNDWVCRGKVGGWE